MDKIISLPIERVDEISGSILINYSFRKHREGQIPGLMQYTNTSFGTISIRKGFNGETIVTIPDSDTLEYVVKKDSEYYQDRLESLKIIMDRYLGYLDQEIERRESLLNTDSSKCDDCLLKPHGNEIDDPLAIIKDPIFKKMIELKREGYTDKEISQKMYKKVGKTVSNQLSVARTILGEEIVPKSKSK
jgi:hypothetical protein